MRLLISSVGLFQLDWFSVFMLIGVLFLDVCPNEDCSPAIKTLAFDKVCEVVGRKRTPINKSRIIVYERSLSAHFRSPGGTPRTGWPKKNFQPDMMPFFNAKLLDKFKNIVTSPVSSPNLASPGTFESPVQDS